MYMFNIANCNEGLAAIFNKCKNTSDIFRRLEICFGISKRILCCFSVIFFFLKKSSNELQRVDLVRIVVYSWLNCFSDFLPFRADIANVSFCFGLFGRWCCLLLVLFFFLLWKHRFFFVHFDFA